MPDRDPINLPPPPATSIPKAGLQQAVCAFIEDMGEKVSPFTNDRGERPVQPKIMLFWELKECMEDGRPYMLSKEYTLSSHEKANLMKLLTSWMGKPPTPDEIRTGQFNLRSLINQNCMLNVIHKEKRDGNMRADVESVAPLMDGLEPLKVQNENPPPWVENRRQENATELEQFRRGTQPGGKGFDAIPF